MSNCDCVNDGFIGAMEHWFFCACKYPECICQLVDDEIVDMVLRELET